MAPTNVKTIHQASLLHFEGNLDRLGLLSPAHGQRFQQQSGKSCLNRFLLLSPSSSSSHTSSEIREVEIPRSMMVEAWSWVKPAWEPASSHPSPCASLKKPHKSCLSAAPCWPFVGKKQTVVRGHLLPQKLPGSRLVFWSRDVG